MPLIDRIEQALDRGVDPDLFERAATALLENRYPWLSPVESGRDLGRDADVYRAIPNDTESRGRILATTGDTLANLRSSHRSWQKEQAGGEFRVDALVIATSRKLTGTDRKKLDDYCRRNELPLPECYGRSWLVNALKNDAAWRERLLGIRGRLDALIFSPRRLAGDDPKVLLGRDQEVAAIRNCVARGQDVVLAGVAGVGKSRVLAALDQAHVVEPLARQYLLDDLLALAPRAVIVDDAHLHPDLFAELARIRTQEGLVFVIIGSCWPDRTNDAALLLSSPSTVLLEPLPRVVIDELVRGAGVTAVRARHLILGQAEGRPGWALRLCEALVGSNGMHVFSGEVLLDHVLRHLRQVADNRLSVDALACIAALGGADFDDIETIARLQNRALPLVMDSLRELATRGLLENQGGRWQLQAVLGPPLVSRWFFGPDRSRSWTSFRKVFPGHGNRLSASLLTAASSTGTAETRVAARKWFQTLSPVEEWDASTLHLVRRYALIDEDAAEVASDAARYALNVSRDPVVLWGGLEYDPVAEAAANLLRTCVSTWCNPSSVQGLLDLALTDSRPRHSHTDHPLRALADLATYLDPDRGSIFDVRKGLLKHSTGWLLTDLDSVRRWEVFSEFAESMLSPAVEGAWLDPARSGVITMGHQIEPAAQLQELVALWKRHVTPLLREPRLGLSGPALKHLLALVAEWLRIAAGIGPGAAAVGADEREAALAGCMVLVEDLKPLLENHPGAAHMAAEALERANQWDLRPSQPWPALGLDPDFEDFVGRREPEADFDAWQLQREQEVANLSSRLLALGPRHGTARFVDLAQFGSDVGITGAEYQLGSAVSKGARDPLTWLKAAVELGAGSLTYGLLFEARRRGQPIGRDIITTALHRQEVRTAAIQAVVDHGVLDEVAEDVLRALNESDARCLDRLFTKDLADPVLGALLGHEVSAIRAQAALAFSVGVKYGPALPEDWDDLWRRAFLEAGPSTSHDQRTWRLKEMLKACCDNDPQLCAEWFARHVRAQEDVLTRSIDGFFSIAKQLPRREREALCRANTQGVFRDRFLSALIGHDAELATKLLSDGTVSADQALNALTGERDAGVAILAPVLLEAGISPHRIVQRVCSHSSWSGEESAAIQADLEWFKELASRDKRLDTLSRVAVADLQADHQRALEAERREAVRGRF